MDFKESATGDLLIGAIVSARVVAEEADSISNQVKWNRMIRKAYRNEL